MSNITRYCVCVCVCVRVCVCLQNERGGVRKHLEVRKHTHKHAHTAVKMTHKLSFSQVLLISCHLTFDLPVTGPVTS